jgi:hypothetical protein
LRTVQYSNLVDQFYYDGYEAFETGKREVEETEDEIPFVFVNGKPITRSEYESQDGQH